MQVHGLHDAHEQHAAPRQGRHLRRVGVQRPSSTRCATRSGSEVVAATAVAAVAEAAAEGRDPARALALREDVL
jgi:hypothetical protein